jgi:molybdopterin/thiamine biosynthesis adenylyltransferase
MKYTAYTPVIKLFKTKKEYDAFLHSDHSITVIDVYRDSAFEDFINQSPSHYFLPGDKQSELFDRYYKELIKKHGNPYALGSWVYHPWDNKLYHLLDEEKYFSLRTSRNRDIITYEQQLVLRNKKIALAGLSVGKNVLLSLLRHGIGNTYTIADSDTVAISNFNRALYSLEDFGKPKCQTTVRDMHAIDPFIQVQSFEHGISEDSLEEFVNGASLIIGAFDNFMLNLSLRKLARKKKIPIISGFDVEKGSLLIIERYDKHDLDLSIFLNNHTEEKIKKASTITEKTDTFINIIGRNHHSKKMLESVYNVGKTLNSYPQLVIATLLTAALFTQAAEAILLGNSTKSFRTFVPLEDFFE